MILLNVVAFLQNNKGGATMFTKKELYVWVISMAIFILLSMSICFIASRHTVDREKNAANSLVETWIKNGGTRK